MIQRPSEDPVYINFKVIVNDVSSENKSNF